ncbi:hypothetical protein PFISCL1PPCAC_13752, partial [Pristionchus fissidentatus]
STDSFPPCTATSSIFSSVHPRMREEKESANFRIRQKLFLLAHGLPLPPWTQSQFSILTRVDTDTSHF